MLDISIPHLLNVLKGDSYIEKFVHTPITITEKFDGTKLTYLRTGDGANDWILAYKGHILHHDTYRFLPGYSEIKDKSYGVSQYIIPINHFDSVMLGKVPVGTEVLIEFIQRKPTVLCDYGRYHDMFMIDARVCRWHVDKTGSRLTTFGKHELTGAVKEEYRKALRLKPLPVLFEGTLAAPTPVAARLAPARPSTKNWNGDWLSYPTSLLVSLGDFESALGGKPEGVVITAATGERMKAVRADQYDKVARKKKKMRWQCSDPADEERYWLWIKALADDIDSDIIKNGERFGSYRQAISAYASEWETLPTARVRRQPPSPRHRRNVVDDLMLTAKLVIDARLWAGDWAVSGSQVAVFPLAGKPIHRGHWSVIERAAKENRVVMLYASTCDRGSVKGSQTFMIWRDVLEKHLPSNVTLRFSDSPYNDAVHEIKSITENAGVVCAVYGDADDCAQMWSRDVLDKRFGRLAENVDVRPVSRGLVNISGTQMRGYITNNERELFEKNLPECLDSSEKAVIWGALTSES